jgi:hypothetical protein
LTLALHKRLHSRKYLYQDLWKKEQLLSFPAIFPAIVEETSEKRAHPKESIIKGHGCEFLVRLPWRQ